jgi:hypothetical protein
MDSPIGAEPIIVQLTVASANVFIATRHPNLSSLAKGAGREEFYV